MWEDCEARTVVVGPTGLDHLAVVMSMLHILALENQCTTTKIKIDNRDDDRSADDML
jgi:hypothetical protein